MAKLSIVVPVYRAEGCLEELYSRLKNSISPLTEDFEILLVEDCGGDRSWELIVQIAKQDPRVRGFQFSRNFGQHFGITAGLDAARGDWVVVMDCDLQDRPEDIPRLYQKALEGYDVVLGKRMNTRKHPIWKRILTRFFYRSFTYLADFEMAYDFSNFRIMSRKVVDQFCQMREATRFFAGLMNWMGHPTVSVEVAHDDRASGKSSYSLRKLFHLAFDTIIAFSDKPLRIAVRVGFLTTFGAFSFGIYFTYLALFKGIPITGWTSLIVSLYFIGGMIMGTLGVMGIYLGKIFDQTKGRPLYIINQRTHT